MGTYMRKFPEWSRLQDRRLAVAAVDFALIAAVLIYGLSVHAVDPLAQPDRVATTVLPYWIGWGVASVLFEVYTADEHRSFILEMIQIAMTWIGGAIIGSAIRSTPLVPGGAPFIFVLVVIAAGLIVLVPWRAILALWEHFRNL